MDVSSITFQHPNPVQLNNSNAGAPGGILISNKGKTLIEGGVKRETIYCRYSSGVLLWEENLKKKEVQEGWQFL